MLKYVDDSKLICEVSSAEDVAESQDSLDAVYKWALVNNMRWNDKKFQVLRLGRNEVLKEENPLFSPSHVIIERKETVKDLGITVDQDLSFRPQRQKALSKCWKKIGWITRTFATRSISFLKTLWTSLVQPHLDYGSIMVAPVSLKCDKLAAERPLKALTKMAWGTKGLNYWERLEKFCLYSNERRMERYKCLYIWKSLNGFVPSLGLKWAGSDSRTGARLAYPKVTGPPGHYRTLQRDSILWEGVRIFNSLPDELKKFTGTKEAFKNLLDRYLSNIPDQPEYPGILPGGRTLCNKQSNSIADWTRVLKIDFSTVLLCDDRINCNVNCSGIEGIAQPNPSHGL